MVIHQCNLKVDGITRYIDNYEFIFDNTFHEQESNYDVYKYAIQNSMHEAVICQGEINIFVYGQTGSGKTHTMVT